MIKYQIKNKEVIITDTYITYGKDSIKYDDIIDFEFSHQYVNFVGGIDFTLIGKNNSIWISVSASNSFLQRTSTTENIEKVQEIVNLVLPKALNGFIRHNFSELSNGGTVKIWKLIFEKNKVLMRPRTSFWTKTVEVMYSKGEVSYERQGIGILGSSGSGSCFYLIDLYNNETYKYSNSANSQPTQGQYLKIKGLFDFMKKISTKSTESKIKLDFLK